MEYDKPKMLQFCGGTARIARGFVSSSGRSCYEVKLLTTTATGTGVHKL